MEQCNLVKVWDACGITRNFVCLPDNKDGSSAIFITFYLLVDSMGKTEYHNY